MPTTTNLTQLTINHVASQEVYDAMAAQNLINENELYLVPGDISIAKENAIYFVKGTQTASTNAWTGVLSAVNNLYDGLTIAYFLPYAGTSSNATLTLILGTNIETAAEPVYYTSTSRATTHYGAGSVIYLTWVSNTTTGYSAVGSATGRWLRSDYANSNTVPAAYCSTAAATAAKTATHTNYALRPNSYELVTITNANTAKSALTLNINGKGAKTIYINGVVSSNSNYTLPAGTYLVFYNGTNYYFRTDGKITGSITGDAATLNGRSDYLTGNDIAPANPEPTASWDSSVTLGTVANKEFKFTMPSNPDTNTTYSLTQDSTDGHKITLTPSPSGTPQTITIPDNDHNYYHQSGSWSGLTYSANNTNAPNIELKFTIPTGATSTTVARGDHTHTFASLTSKPTTISGYGITNAYTKTEIDGKLSAVFHYKGTKATVGDLPTTGNTAGDVWHVDADGSEYVFTSGLLWEELGTAVDLSGYAQLSGANFTGPVNFGDSVTADDVTTGALVVTGNASFTNNIQANTINGVEVGSNPKFTDTTYTTTQSAKTNITISDHTTTSVGSASGWSAGSFTRGNFSGGSGSFSTSVSNHIMSFSHTHNAATHAADSFAAPTLTITSTTVTTGTTHTVNDNGHTHSI